MITVEKLKKSTSSLLKLKTVNIAVLLSSCCVLIMQAVSHSKLLQKTAKF